jgi:hypothetical protein
MSERRRFAVIPTRDRPEEYAACVAAIEPQVDDIITVCHGKSSVAYSAGLPISYNHDAPNISAMWNLGLDCLAEAFPDVPYDVAVINDDAVVPPHWFDHLGHMHLLDAAAACVDPHGELDAPLLHKAPGPVSLRQRLTGFAFVLDGTRGIRADERMRWWLSDDWIDWTARTRGGTLIMPGTPVQHPGNGGTLLEGDLSRWYTEDLETFRDYWGDTPL